jgi:hypothetical protein
MTHRTADEMKRERERELTLSFSRFFRLLGRLLEQDKNSSSIVCTYTDRTRTRLNLLTTNSSLASCIVLVLFFCAVVERYAMRSCTTSIIPTMTLTIYIYICVYYFCSLISIARSNQTKSCVYTYADAFIR